MNTNSVDIDKVIADHPVRQRLELSGKARQFIAILSRFRSSLGFMPEHLQRKLQPDDWDSEQKIKEAVSETVAKNPFKGYFSLRHDPLRPHPLMQQMRQQSVGFINDQIWTVIFDDFHKEHGMSIDIFNFLTLKMFGEPPSGCLVTGYNIPEDAIDGNENFDNLPTRDTESQ